MTPQQPDESGFISLQSWQNVHDRILFEREPVDLPRLALWNYRHKLSLEGMRDAISEVWMFVNDGLASLPDLPEIEGATVERLTHDQWVELFSYAGYIRLEDPEIEGAGVTCEIPTTLYRYAEETGKTGLSWTTSIDEALAYAGRFGDGSCNGCVWSVNGVDPDRILAHFHQKTGEDEYVFDPRRSEIGCTCKQS